MHTTRRHHTRKTRRPLGGGAPPGRSRPGRRRAWWRFRWLPGLASLTGCKPKETHYLSASACQDVRNSARSHNKPEKPPQNRTPHDSKRNLEIQRNCKVFDLENYQKTRKSPSFVHFNGSKAIPERFDFAGVSPVSYGCAPSYGRPERKDSELRVRPLPGVAFLMRWQPTIVRKIILTARPFNRGRHTMWSLFAASRDFVNTKQNLEIYETSRT